MSQEKFVRVPVEPTEEMLDVFHDRIRILCTPEKREASVLNDVEVYKAMIAAAPQEPQAEQPQAQDESFSQEVAKSYQRDVEKAVRAAERWSADIPELTDRSPENVIETLAYLLLQARASLPAKGEQAPAQPQTLSDEDIKEIAEPYHSIYGFKDVEFARAIERAGKPMLPKPRAVIRESECSVLVDFNSCHEASVFERAIKGEA